MKALSPCFILLACLASCAPSGPVSTIPRPREIEVRDSNFTVVSSIQESADVGFVVMSIENANRIGDTASVSHSYSHMLDLGDRWRYDTKTGDLVLLTKATTSVFRVRDEDRTRFENLLKTRGRTNRGWESAISISIS